MPKSSLMSRYNKPIDFKTKDIFLQAAVLVGTIALLVWFLPHDRFKYRYEEGRPWPYSQIISEFEFPILKSEEQLANERDSIHRTAVYRRSSFLLQPRA